GRKAITRVAGAGSWAGGAAGADPIRETLRRTVGGLRSVGIEVAMIAGENRQTGEAVASQLGIQRVFAEVLPEQKADYVTQLQQDLRSEEHTSELQSLTNLVCRLLLEKKKNTYHIQLSTHP